MTARTTNSLLRHSRPTGGATRRKPGVSPEVAELLTAYWELLEPASALPALVWLRWRDTFLGRIARVPRVRTGSRYFLVQHMRLTLRGLERGSIWRGSLEGGESFAADAAALNGFAQALPPVVSRRMLAFVVALTVFLVSFTIANSVKLVVPHTGHLAGATAQPLGKMTGAILMLDRGNLTKAIESFACTGVGTRAQKCSTTQALMSGPTSLVLVAVTIWLILFLPMCAFRMQRTLLGLSKPTAAAVRAAFASDEHPARGSALALEERALARIRMARPKEPPLEPLVQTTVLIVPLALGVLIATPPAFVTIAYGGDFFEVSGLVSLFAALYGIGGFLLLAALIRFLHVRRAWMRRSAPAEVAAFCAGQRRRRAAAQLVDGVAIGAIAAGLGTPVWLRVSNHELRAIALVLGVAPLAALVYSALSFLRRAERRGLTLGAQLLGIRTVCRGGSRAGARRICIREAVLKWLPFCCAVYALLISGAPHMPGYAADLLDSELTTWTSWLVVGLLSAPFFLNALWPLVDHQKRTLHDIAADTIVIKSSSLT
jgi:uncharacterized RDD family membrane protein YckC